MSVPSAHAGWTRAGAPWGLLQPHTQDRGQRSPKEAPAWEGFLEVEITEHTWKYEEDGHALDGGCHHWGLTGGL